MTGRAVLFAATIVAAAALVISCGGDGDEEPVRPTSAEDAAASMGRVLPAAVALWKPPGPGLSPDLDASLRVRKSLEGGAVDRVASNGFWLATGAGRWSILPRGASRTAARTATRRQVALFANAAEGIDLAVRPTPVGASTFVHFRAGASHSFRWRLSLPGDERVVRLPKGGAGIFAPSVQLEPRATTRTTAPRNRAAERPHVGPLSDELGGAYAPRTGPDNRLAATVSAPLGLDRRRRRVRTSLAVRGDEVTLTIDPAGNPPFPVVVRVDWMPAGPLGNGWFVYGVPTALRRSRYALEGKRIPGVGCASEERGEIGSGEVQVTRQVAARGGGCVSLVENGAP